MESDGIPLTMCLTSSSDNDVSIADLKAFDKNALHCGEYNRDAPKHGDSNLEDIFYMSIYTYSQVCTALNTVFDLILDQKYYQSKELNKKIKEILK